MRALVLLLCAAACGGEAPPPASPSPRPLTAAELRAGASGGPEVIAPSRLEPLRIAGEKNIWPDDKRVSRRCSIKFCLDEAGQITMVSILQRSGDEAYDLIYNIR
jgi:hypothetical protein